MARAKCSLAVAAAVLLAIRLVTAQAPAETGGQQAGRKPAESAATFQAVSGGLTINAIFDSTIANDPNAAAIESTINSAIAIYQSRIFDPINVTIIFGAMSGGVGRSSWFSCKVP